MKLTTLDAKEARDLSEWLRAALANGRPVELHVVAQGWVYRSQGLEDFLMTPEGNG